MSNRLVLNAYTSMVILIKCREFIGDGTCSSVVPNRYTTIALSAVGISVDMAIYFVLSYYKSCVAVSEAAHKKHKS